MAAFLNTPMTAVGGENTSCVSFLRSLAGDAIGCFTRGFASLFICAMAFNDESLPNLGEVQIVIEFGDSPYLADFDAPMLGRYIIGAVWLLTFVKEELEASEERELICLYCQVMVSLTLSHQIIGECAVSLKGIPGDDFAFDIDGIKEQDRQFDVVSAFGFFVAFFG